MPGSPTFAYRHELGQGDAPTNVFAHEPVPENAQTVCEIVPAPFPCTPPRCGYTGTSSRMLYWAALETRVGFGNEKRKILALPLQDLDLLRKTLSMVDSVTGLCSGSSDD